MASRRVRIILWSVAIVAVVAIITSASVAFIIFRSMTSSVAAEAAATQAFDEIRKMYPGRPPLIDIAGGRVADARINRTPNAPRKNVDTIHFMYWDPEDGKLVRGEAPLWITSLRVSITGVGNWSFSDFHVTREDIERYSPGLLVDFKAPDGPRAIAWTR
jgi:hypothetical protein